MKVKIIALITTSGNRDLSKTMDSIVNQLEKVYKIIIASEININCPYEVYINPYKKGLARNTMQALTRIYLKYGRNVFVATLDDDDRWDKSYIKEVKQKIKQGFNFISTQMIVKKDGRMFDIYKPIKIDINSFLYGNVGIQGSNKVFKLSMALEAGGMPKHINAATDRAFNINFLMHPDVHYHIISKPLVIYNKDELRPRITNDPKRFSELQNFYKHFWNYIDENKKNKINTRHQKLHNLTDVITW